MFSEFYQLCLLTINQTILKMKEKLAVVLEQLKKAKIQVSRRTLRMQVSLFDYDDSNEIEFNGHRSISALEEQLYSSYISFKRQMDETVNSSIHQPELLKKELDLTFFEVKEFRQRFFPKDNNEVLLHRVELYKSSHREITSDETIKKNPKVLFCSTKCS